MVRDLKELKIIGENCSSAFKLKNVKTLEQDGFYKFHWRLDKSEPFSEYEREVLLMVLKDIFEEPNVTEQESKSGMNGYQVIYTISFDIIAKP